MLGGRYDRDAPSARFQHARTACRSCCAGSLERKRPLFSARALQPHVASCTCPILGGLASARGLSTLDVRAAYLRFAPVLPSRSPVRGMPLVAACFPGTRSFRSALPSIRLALRASALPSRLDTCCCRSSSPAGIAATASVLGLLAL